MSWTATRKLVLARDGGLCALCGTAVGEPWECHHRLLRSHGRDDSLENLIALHGRCHSHVHVQATRWAYAHGFLVPSWRTVDFRHYPVFRYRTAWSQPGTEAWALALPRSIQQDLVDAFNHSATRGVPDPTVGSQSTVDTQDTDPWGSGGMEF